MGPPRGFPRIGLRWAACLLLGFALGGIARHYSGPWIRRLTREARETPEEPLTRPMTEVAGDGPAPRLSIRLHPDPLQGMNLELLTEHFRFSPERAGSRHVPGEGHAGIQVNGNKIARCYGPWFHLRFLPPGTHLVEVTLCANDLTELSLKGVPISDHAIVRVRAGRAIEWIPSPPLVPI